MHHTFPYPIRWLSLFLMTLIVWALLTPTQAGLAATRLVTNSNDSGAGSLRQTLADAVPDEMISFAAELSGATIVLTSGPITLNQRLTIDGSNLAIAPTLSGNNAKGIFSLGSSSVLTITRLSLSNGKSTYGGAIYNGGTLTLDRVTLAANQALNGGALYNVGNVALLNSTISGNSAYSGGGIDNYGQLVIKNSTLAGNSAVNSGGALYNAGTLQLYNTILADSSGDVECHNANDPFFNLFGVISANVRSLTEDGSCATALSGDPKLGALTLVDGVLIQPLATDSPALAAGDSATCLAVDQRLAPRLQGTGCDLGAVERLTSAPTATATPTPLPTLGSGTPSPTAPVDPSVTTTPTPIPGTPTITPTIAPSSSSTLYLPVIHQGTTQ